MSLDKVLAISGKPGLYQFITQARGAFIAESLLDKKRITVTAQQNISVLNDIAIYTLEEDMPLKEVLAKIKEKESGEKTSINPKDSKDKLEEYFFNVLPNYDEDRVYASDIKKVLQWYNILQEHDMLGLLDTEKEDAPSAQEDTK